MNILHTSLFASSSPRALGVGFHNVGSQGVLRASNEAMLKYVRHYYGERCGHLPLNAETIHVLVSTSTPEIQAQMAYLSSLFGKSITPTTFDELKYVKEQSPELTSLVVPYITVSEVEARLRKELGAETWGLPGRMTDVLKNKASFYALVQEFDLEGFTAPDYVVSHIYEVASDAERFLGQIEDLYKKTGVAGAYPLGVMLRASEEDGNYGCCLVYENAGRIIVVQDGDASHLHSYTQWHDALVATQEHLAATMNVQREARVVISRYIDVADSPGMSVVIMENQVESLRWNGQLQKPGSKACVGTSSYIPGSAYLKRMQQVYEEQTAAFFELLLRKTAEQCGIEFSSIRGVANLDIMIPGELEKRLQRLREQPERNYLAECNPRWTNYTDAIMTILGASRRDQTLSNMRSVIAEGIATFDKYPLPQNVNPQDVRTSIAERDEVLKREGTRILCRMAKNPMGLIFAGDVARAQQEVNALLTSAALAPVPGHTLHN